MTVTDVLSELATAITQLDFIAGALPSGYSGAIYPTEFLCPYLPKFPCALAA